MDPSFFLTNKTGAPQGEELGLIKPLSDSSFSCSDNSFIWIGVHSIKFARATGAAPGYQINLKLTCRSRRKADMSIRKILQESLELLAHPQVASSPTSVVLLERTAYEVVWCLPSHFQPHTPSLELVIPLDLPPVIVRRLFLVSIMQAVLLSLARWLPFFAVIALGGQDLYGL
ncbi:hypothetical protein Tco_0588680 [Tanacetum coccineum]